jgi:hypothetical protein
LRQKVLRVGNSASKAGSPGKGAQRIEQAHWRISPSALGPVERSASEAAITP